MSAAWRQMNATSNTSSPPLRTYSSAAAIAQTASRHSAADSGRSHVSMMALIGGLGVASYAAWRPRTLLLDSTDDAKAHPRSYMNARNEPPLGGSDPSRDDPELPESDVNVYNLGFGSVCGICAGIFIKKGLKFVAFLLGGGFVLLQVSART